MEGKRTQDSSITMSHVMLPQDTNPAGNVHGGVVMKHIDNAAVTVAIRHTRCNAVTASIDRMDFYNPVFLGNILVLKARLNLVGRTSMEIGVRAEAEDPYSGTISHTASAYLTVVALDEKGRPKEAPPLILETQDEIRRHNAARARRKARLEERTREEEKRHIFDGFKSE
jgi:acyl-CoA hydrolase